MTARKYPVSMPDKRRLHAFLGNSFYMLCLQLANFIVPFGIFSLISSNSGNVILGSYFFFISLIFLTNTFCDFGLTITTLSRLKSIRYKRKYIRHVFLLKFIFLGISLFVVPIFLIIIDASITDYILVCIALFFQVMLPTWFFQYEERMKVVAVSGIVGKLLNLALVFLFVESSSQLSFFINMFAIGAGLTFALNIIAFHVRFSCYPTVNQSLNLKYALCILAISFQTFKSRVALVLYTSLNSVLVAVVLGIQYVAIFGMAEKIYTAGQGVITPVSQVLFPFMSNRPDVNLYKKIVLIFIFVFIFGVSSIYLNVEFVLNVLFSDVPDESISLTKLFLLISVVNCMSILLGYPAFAIVGRIDIPNRSVIYGAYLYLLIIGGLFTFERFSLLNLGFAILFVELFTMLFRLSLFFKLVKKL